MYKETVMIGSRARYRAGRLHQIASDARSVLRDPHRVLTPHGALSRAQPARGRAAVRVRARQGLSARGARGPPARGARPCHRRRRPPPLPPPSPLPPSPPRPPRPPRPPPARRARRPSCRRPIARLPPPGSACCLRLARGRTPRPPPARPGEGRRLDYARMGGRMEGSRRRVGSGGRGLGRGGVRDASHVVPSSKYQVPSRSY
jgi:hypothetical protein